MNYILFDGKMRSSLLPFTFTRPVAEIRIGILTIREKWEKYLGAATSTLTEPYLAKKFPLKTASSNILINASFLPDLQLLNSIRELKGQEALLYEGEPIAVASALVPEVVEMAKYKAVEYKGEVFRLKNTWDIFSANGEAIKRDFELLTRGRRSAPVSGTNQLINPENIFLEEGARVEYSILNATEGPIYIGRNAEVWEGNLIRGAFALGEHAVVKMGARIYGPTTVGPHAKVCGEINNSVIFGYSSKGHDGYLGNSVLGEWCNIGADSNNSNLKNNYAKVRLWNYATESFEHTGLQFCGLMMGDHSKTAINTMFNTGTVIGVNSNIYVPGFPRNFIPSFSWGGASGFSTYQPGKAFDTARVMMARRNVEFSAEDAEILQHVFDITARWRNY
jgi:UDP-N-acetylglucosamine diphosphorylase/glucosamine-1-phosphate N-acetyltransferase